MSWWQQQPKLTQSVRAPLSMFIGAWGSLIAMGFVFHWTDMGMRLTWAFPLFTAVFLLVVCLFDWVDAEPPRRDGHPIIGYRLWKVERGRLHAVTNDSTWLPKAPMVADRWRPYREVPTETNRIGVYAMKRPSGVALGYEKHCLFGEVNLWGRVIECDYGYRAQFGYPRRLVGGHQVGKILAATYGVPHISWHRWCLERFCHECWRVGARARRCAGGLARRASGA